MAKKRSVRLTIALSISAAMINGWHVNSVIGRKKLAKYLRELADFVENFKDTTK